MSARNDRLAAFRNQRQQNVDVQEGHELAPVNHQADLERGPDGNGYNDSGLNGFYSEAASIQDDIQRFDNNVTNISNLHSRSLNVADLSTNHKAAAELDELVAETRGLGNTIRTRIQRLNTYPGTTVNQRRERTEFLRERFVKSLQRYQTVEADYRAKYKERVARQFKIVKPDATQDEINAVVAGDDGNLVFAQALSNSTSYEQARSAYRDVQERHQDIRKIEETFAELAQLIQDMSVLVEQQGETIDAAETNAAKVEMDTNVALGHTEKAVVSARRARRLRWVCFWITFTVIAIIAIVLGIYFGVVVPHNNSSKNSSSA